MALAVDKYADHPSVKSFFVSHEGKKTLSVEDGTPSIHDVDYEWFFKEMSNKISENINKPEYTQIMDTDFSTSSPVHKIANQIMLMYSFQKYFEYEMMYMVYITKVFPLCFCNQLYKLKKGK